MALSEPLRSGRKYEATLDYQLPFSGPQRVTAELAGLASYSSLREPAVFATLLPRTDCAAKGDPGLLPAHQHPAQALAGQDRRKFF